MVEPVSDSVEVLGGVNKGPGLCEHARNITSQYGEDGIIHRALEIIGATDKWCVEFGAWDGKHLSNTYSLIQEKGYSAVLIEGDKSRSVELKRRYQENSKVDCVNEFVGFETSNQLDAILSKTKIPKDFDLLSIDIDGNDYYIWETVKTYRPKLVVIEYNPTIPNSVDFVQPKNLKLNQGCSLAALTRLGKSKGYELIAATTVNGIFVDSKYYPKFGITQNSLDTIRTDNRWTTYLFCGFDGTIFLRGNNLMPWHGIEITEKSIQQLPAYLRTYPGHFNILQRALLRLIQWL